MLESEIRPFLLKRAPTESLTEYTESTWSTASHQQLHCGSSSCPPTSPADKRPEPNTETLGTQLEFVLVSIKSGELFEHCGTRVRLANSIQQAADITAVTECLRFLYCENYMSLDFDKYIMLYRLRSFIHYKTVEKEYIHRAPLPSAHQFFFTTNPYNALVATRICRGPGFFAIVRFGSSPPHFCKEIVSVSQSSCSSLGPNSWKHWSLNTVVFSSCFWKEISRVIDWLREMKNKYLTVRFGIHILISRFGLFIFYTNTEKRFVYIDQFIYVPLPHSTDNL
jgi:hypothetical protein